MRAEIHSQQGHITSTTMGTTGNLLYATHHINPSQSAFSHSSTPSLMSDRSLDKSFLKRMFSRGKARFSQGTLSSNRRPNATRSAPESPVIFGMTPSPHTHPLLSKPSARDELRTSYRQSKRIIRSSSHGDLSSAKARYPRPRKFGLQQGSVEDDDSVDVYNLTSPDMYARNLRSRERVAMDAAIDGRYVSEWGFFIKCYSEGRFNVSNPPDPPPRRPDFNHLAAPVPPNERRRLQAVRDYNVSLTTAAHEKLLRLVLLSKKVFQTRMVSISLIDEHDEILKVGDSFDRSFVDREDSLGAHVLLANEPMVILDTQKDWRLRGNPLVTGPPKIRFYAGAPIVTHEGHAIGVFAVFDTQPHTTFPAASRRKLMDFARLVMTEIELAVEERDLPQRLSLKSSRPRRHASDAGSVMSRRSRITARLLQGFEDDASALHEETPVPEHLADSPTIDSWPQSPIRPPTPAEDPSSPTTEKSIPAVSISLATPPSTPHRLSLASSTRGPPSPRNSLESVTASSHPDATLGASRYRSRCPPPIHLAPKTTPSPTLPRSPTSMSSLVEATFATSLIARSLNYDLVYLLRLTRIPIAASPLLPVDPFCPHDEIHTRVLVAHGLPDPPPKFDSALHLRALNSAGGLIYQNPVDGGSEIDNVGYQVGILMPLAKDGGAEDAEEGEGGIVLAAYARGGAGKRRFGEREVEFLREFGGAMRDVLVKADTPGFAPLKEPF